MLVSSSFALSNYRMCDIIRGGKGGVNSTTALGMVLRCSLGGGGAGGGGIGGLMDMDVGLYASAVVKACSTTYKACPRAPSQLQSPDAHEGCRTSSASPYCKCWWPGLAAPHGTRERGHRRCLKEVWQWCPTAALQWARQCSAGPQQIPVREHVHDRSDLQAKPTKPSASPHRELGNILRPNLVVFPTDHVRSEGRRAGEDGLKMV